MRFGTSAIRTRKGLANDEEYDEQSQEDAAVKLARGAEDLGVREARRGVELIGDLVEVGEESRVGSVRVGRDDRGGVVGAGTGHFVDCGGFLLKVARMHVLIRHEMIVIIVVTDAFVSADGIEDGSHGAVEQPTERIHAF